jgi:hypothetical protein
MTPAFYGVGEITGHNPSFDNTSAYFANVAGHAALGCASAVASGNKCGSSALAGAVTSAAGPYINNIGFTGSLVANAVVGGLSAVAGGGKFENGAITAAFGYFFNSLGRSATSPGGNTGGTDIYVPPEGVQVACPVCAVVTGVVESSGPDSLNRISASISGTSAGIRLPRGGAAW